MSESPPPLRRLRRDDLEAIAEYRSNPAVTSSLVGHTHTMSLEGAEGWYEYQIGDSGSNAIRTIVDGNDAAIGYAFVRLTDAATRRGEFAILIGDTNHWGKGVGREVTSWFLDLAFSSMGLLKIELEVLASNERAIRLYQGLGFKTEGETRGGALRWGEYINVIRMGLFANEWRDHQ